MKAQVQVLSSSVAYTAHTFQVHRQTLQLPDKRTIERDVVRHPGAAVFIPQLANGNVLLVRQFRQPLASILLEFPAGTLNKAEDPLACAQREIEEETGHTAREWIDMGKLYPAPGFCDEIQYCYFARDLHRSAQSLDEDEIIEVISMSPEEIELQIKQGTIQDSKTISIFFKAKLAGLL